MNVIVEGVLISVIGAGVFALLVYFLRPRVLHYLTKRPHKKLFGFKENERVLIVLPARKTSSDEKGLLKSIRIAFEDMVALAYIERMLLLAGISENRIKIRQHKTFGKVNTGDLLENLVLICSPKSNPITKKYLDKITNSTPLKWTIEEDKNGQMYIDKHPGRRPSPSYEQESNNGEECNDVDTSRFDDIALVVRANNPFKAGKKVLIIAGMRGIGTWGAAKYLRNNYRKINTLFKGGDFALIVSVHYENYRIQEVELCGHTNL